MNAKPGLVYFMKPVGLAGPIKIGCSDTPAIRLSALASWSPWPLEILATVDGSFKLENSLHRIFSASQTHGEWFHPVAALVAGIEAILAGKPIEEAFDFSKDDGSLRRKQSPRSPETKRRMSYALKVAATERRLRKRLGDHGRWHAPKDVEEIISNWSGGYFHRNVVIPTPQEVARLDAYLANAETHSVRFRLYEVAA